MVFDAEFNPIYRVVCKFMSDDDANTSLSLYRCDLVDLFSFASIGDDDSGHPHFKGPNEELDITAYINSDKASEYFIDFVNYVAPAPSNGWEEVSATLQNLVGEGNVVPNLLVDDAIQYSTSNNGTLFVRIDFPEDTVF